MMAFEEMIMRIEELGEDVSYSTSKQEDGMLIRVIVEDFEGFDDDWSEIFRDFDEEKIDEFLEEIEKECVEFVEDFYSFYDFGDFVVKVGYASYDI